MTNSEHLEELLHEAHELGIYDAVTTLSIELRETNPKLDLYGAIELAFSKINK